MYIHSPYSSTMFDPPKEDNLLSGNTYADLSGGVLYLEDPLDAHKTGTPHKQDMRAVFSPAL